MSSVLETLTPGQQKQIQFGGAGAASMFINNQSNCWLTYQGQYIGNPYQQSVYAFPSPDAAPLLALTATAPPGQSKQASPTGTCYLTLSSEVQPGNPGVVGAQLSVQQQQLLLASISCPGAGVTTTSTVDVPSWAATLMFIAGTGVGNSASTVSGVGVQSAGVYNTTSGPFNQGQVFGMSVVPGADQQVTLTILNNNASAAGGHLFVVGVSDGIYQLLGKTEVTAVAGDVVALTIPSDGAALASGIAANSTTVLTVPSQSGIQSITVFNAGAGSCTAELLGNTTGFQYLTPTALASQASLTADVFRTFDPTVDLIVTGTAGVINVNASGNLYPAASAGSSGSASTSSTFIVQSGFVGNVGGGLGAFLQVGCGGAAANEGRARGPVGVKLNATTIHIQADTAPGAGNSYTATLNKNGVGTALTATMTGAVATDATGTATIGYDPAANDSWSITVTSTAGSAATARFSVSIVCTTA